MVAAGWSDTRPEPSRKLRPAGAGGGRLRGGRWAGRPPVDALCRSPPGRWLPRSARGSEIGLRAERSLKHWRCRSSTSDTKHPVPADRHTIRLSRGARHVVFSRLQPLPARFVKPRIALYPARCGVLRRYLVSRQGQGGRPVTRLDVVKMIHGVVIAGKSVGIAPDPFLAAQKRLARIGHAAGALFEVQVGGDLDFHSGNECCERAAWVPALYGRWGWKSPRKCGAIDQKRIGLFLAQVFCAAVRSTSLRLGS